MNASPSGPRQPSGIRLSRTLAQEISAACRVANANKTAISRQFGVSRKTVIRLSQAPISPARCVVCGAGKLDPEEACLACKLRQTAESSTV